MNPNVTISGHIGVFNTLTLFNLSTGFDNKTTFQADENGYISISVFPGEYYISLDSVKVTVLVESDIDIKDIVNVKN